MGESTNARAFEHLNEYLDQRADEARPEEKEKIVESEPESEVDMTWLNELRKNKANKGATSSTKQKNVLKPGQRENGRKTVAPTPPPGTAKGKALRSIPTPAESRSTRDQSLKEPRDALKSSSLYASKDATMTDVASLTAFSPATLTAGDGQPSIGSPMEFSAAVQAPAQSGSAERASVGSPNQNLNPAPPAHSPEPYTPVQLEDAAIFEPKYFAIITQRMEQDRERQRRKEDNAGFIAPAADPESDDAKYAEMWEMFKNMDPEAVVKDMEDQIAREHRELAEHAKYDVGMQKRFKNEADRDAALKAKRKNDE